MVRFTCAKCGKVKRVRNIKLYPDSICGFCKHGQSWDRNRISRAADYRRNKKINRKSKERRVS